jgi:hypothetical protein
MKIRGFIVCLCSLSTGVQLAWADASSKAAKIAELMQLTGTRQFLHEVDGKADQEEAARAWGRFYSQNVSERDLDAILAYYRSPAGQQDVSASRAALGEVQRYMAQKRAPTAVPAVAANGAQERTGRAPAPTSATSAVAASGAQTAASGPGPAARGSTGVGPGVGSAPSGTATGAGVRSATSGTGTAAGVGSASSGTTAGAATAGAVGPISSVPPSAGERPWDTAPRAPDGRVVASPSLPEQCDVPPTPAPGSHAVAPSGKSVVCICTDEKGILTREPVIAESSGDARVDSGAIKMARVDSGRYIPPTVDGHPQSACFRFAIDFSHHQ